MESLLSEARLTGFQTGNNKCLKTSHPSMLKNILPLLSKVNEKTQTQTQTPPK